MCSADRYSSEDPTLPAASSDLQAVAVTSVYEDIYLKRSKWQSIQEELDTFDLEQLPDSEELKRLRKIVTEDDKKERELKASARSRSADLGGSSDADGIGQVPNI